MTCFIVKTMGFILNFKESGGGKSLKFINAVYIDGVYIKIILHRRYTPRLLETVHKVFCPHRAFKLYPIRVSGV